MVDDRLVEETRHEVYQSLAFEAETSPLLEEKEQVSDIIVEGRNLLVLEHLECFGSCLFVNLYYLGNSFFYLKGKIIILFPLLNMHYVLFLTLHTLFFYCNVLIRLCMFFRFLELYSN